MKKDDININEAYAKIYNQQLDEGIWDVAKARGAQAIGAVKGLGQRVGGAYQQTKGGLVQKAVGAGAKALGLDPKQSELYQKARKEEREGKAQVKASKETAQGAKYNTYINSALNGLVKDLKRLNIPINDENAMKNEIFAVLKRQMSEIKTSGGQFSVGSSTKVGLNAEAFGNTAPAKIHNPVDFEKFFGSISDSEKDQLGKEALDFLTNNKLSLPKTNSEYEILKRAAYYGYDLGKALGNMRRSPSGGMTAPLKQYNIEA
jgi:hypothetical protein